MPEYNITFFCTDKCEKQALQPIADEASARGIPVKFSANSDEKVDIGVYCQHLARPRARLSVVMLHDMAQRHDVWPDYWAHEPWNEFDIGIVPGPLWGRMWGRMKQMRFAQPRIGVFELGWPKADLIYKDISSHESEVDALRDKLDLKYEHTVTYAPSWENHGKQSDFVNALFDLPVNLLLKQAPWSAAYPQVLDSIKQQNSLHENISDKVKIIDPEISIMRVLGLSDLLVSDESSVLFEACLSEVPSLAVSDWLIPDRNPPRLAVVPLQEIAKTPKNELADAVMKMLGDLDAEKQKCIKIREFLYSELGSSSKKIMDLIDGIVSKQTLVCQPIN